MTDTDKLYESWIRKGSYFNRMLDCGSRYNRWVELALHYLPQMVLDEIKNNIVFIATAQLDACRVTRHYSENREIIILSERILPKQGANEGQVEVRYFIYVVLHEVVHAIKKHKSPKFDNLTEQENEAQEREAYTMAFEWFNKHIKKLNNPYQKQITKEEITDMQEKNQVLMQNLYRGG